MNIFFFKSTQKEKRISSKRFEEKKLALFRNCALLEAK